MAQDRHLGRGSPTFYVQGHPDTFIGLLTRHGVFSRVMRARLCPCSGATGSPNMYCNLCRGDGWLYDFQRKFLQSDEDSDVRAERNIVYPFRVPVLEPIAVERLLPTEQGGITKYVITGWDRERIFITGEPLPLHWQKMRVSYYFDRYEYVADEVVAVDAQTKTLTTTTTRTDDAHLTGNVMDASGDIAIINRIWDSGSGHEYSQYTFAKNKIYLGGAEPTPGVGTTHVEYYYVPVTRAMVADLENRDPKEKWESSLLSGMVRMSFEPWYDLGEGDVVTLLTPEFARDEVLVHASTGIDRLLEFDVSGIVENVFDEDGVRYSPGTDFVLKNYHDMHWQGGRQPQAGKKVSVRYRYHPSFRVFQEGPMPNTLENRQYPKTVVVRIWNRTLNKDVEKLANPTWSY